MNLLMKCNTCGRVVEPIDALEHKEKTGHNSWKMMKKLAQKSKLLLIGLLVLSLLVAPILGCTATDPITDDIYIEGDLYVWDGAAWQLVAGGGGVGGLYGINVETLAGGITLTPGTDEIYQYLNPNGANRIITLATVGATAGDRFVVRNNGNSGSPYYLTIKQVANTIETIYVQAIKEFVFDGTNWVAANSGTGLDGTDYNLALGSFAKAYDWGVALGYKSVAYANGVAVGNQATGRSYGVGIGYNASGLNYGTAVGYQTDGDTFGAAFGYQANGGNYGTAIGARTKTNDKYYGIALGYYSETERYGETSTNIDANSTQKNNVVQGRWSKTTTNATPVEVFCAAVANQRFTIRASSALAFKMTIVARDNVANEVAMYTVEDGLIKRDAAGNTVMVNCTVTTIHEDDAGWDVAVTADDTNEALIITVTGDGTNPVQWAVRMDGVETHF